MDGADLSDWPDAPCRRGRKQGKVRGLGIGSGVQSPLLPGQAACGTFLGEEWAMWIGGKVGRWSVWASDGDIWTSQTH